MLTIIDDKKKCLISEQFKIILGQFRDSGEKSLFGALFSTKVKI